MSKYQYLIREYFFRILKKSPLPVRRLAAKVFVGSRKKQLRTLKTPAVLILYVTNRCNARCGHCFYWKEVAGGKKHELSLEQIEKIVRSLKNPLATLSITGGEPFLRDDLAKTCQIFFKLNQTQKINIATNGFSAGRIEKTAEEILNTCPIDLNIQVSLDGLKEYHDSLRKVPIFDKAVETIGHLEKLSRRFKNFQATVQTTITRQNVDEIGRLGKFVKEKFPTVHHGFQFVRAASFDVYQIDKNILSGLDPKLKEPLLSVEEMKKSFQRFSQFLDKENSLLNSYVNVMNERIIEMKEKEQPFVKCLAGKYDAVIWPDGGVSMCEFTKPFADLKDFDFDFYDLWESEKADAMRGKVQTCFCTHTCNLLNAMQSSEKALLEVLSH